MTEFSPGQVAELRVDGAADDFASDAAELLCSVTERHNLSGAHEREIQGVEEEDHIFPWGMKKTGWEASPINPH